MGTVPFIKRETGSFGIPFRNFGVRIAVDCLGCVVTSLLRGTSRVGQARSSQYAIDRGIGFGRSARARWLW